MGELEGVPDTVGEPVSGGVRVVVSHGLGDEGICRGEELGIPGKVLEWNLTCLAIYSRPEAGSRHL
jgi:hypothetical protein